MPSLVAFRQKFGQTAWDCIHDRETDRETERQRDRQTDRQYKEQQCVSGCTDEWQQSMIKGNNAYVQYAKQYQCRLKSNWEDASDDGWDDERKHRRASSDRDCRSQRYEHRRPDHSRHTAVYLCYTHTHTHTHTHGTTLIHCQTRHWTPCRGLATLLRSRPPHVRDFLSATHCNSPITSPHPFWAQWA